MAEQVKVDMARNKAPPSQRAKDRAQAYLVKAQKPKAQASEAQLRAHGVRRCGTWRREVARSHVTKPGANASRYWALSVNGLGVGFPLNDVAVARGIRPLGVAGSRARLQSVLRDCMRSGDVLKIVVLGSSMTFGHGLPMGALPWPGLLEELFASADIGVRVEVDNMGTPGASSAIPMGHWNNIKARIAYAHVVILDFAVTDRLDAIGRPQGMFGRTAKGIQHVYGQLLGLIASLKSRPAVLDLETQSGTNRSLCDMNITEYPHWQVLLEKEIPVVSFSEAVCPAGHTFWNHDTLDEAGYSLPDPGPIPHPGLMTHDLVSRLILAAFLDALEGACETISEAGEAAHEAARDAPAHPAPPLDALDVRTLCLAEQTHTALHSDDGSMRSVGRANAVWNFYEDVPEKPGWIANSSGAPADIAFDIGIAQGWIQLEILKTYENIGSVVCWLDAQAPSPGNACRVDGLWESRTSIQSFVYLRAVAPAGRHTLSCRSNGKKFKLMSITSC